MSFLSCLVLPSLLCRKWFHVCWESCTCAPSTQPQEQASPVPSHVARLLSPLWWWSLTKSHWVVSLDHSVIIDFLSSPAVFNKGCQETLLASPAEFVDMKNLLLTELCNLLSGKPFKTSFNLVLNQKKTISTKLNYFSLALLLWELYEMPPNANLPVSIIMVFQIISRRFRRGSIGRDILIFFTLPRYCGTISTFYLTIYIQISQKRWQTLFIMPCFAHGHQVVCSGCTKNSQWLLPARRTNP